MAYVFPDSSQEEVIRIDRLAEEIGTVQGLRNSFHPILNIILAALDAPPIFMRTKALRALGQIVTSDATILSTVNCPAISCLLYVYILLRPMFVVPLKAIS
jgi:cohesin loading factor subunit SCC2